MSYFHLTVTPEGLQLAGVILAKRNRDGTLAIHEGRLSALLYAAYGKTISPQAMRYFKSAGELTGKIKPSDWDNRTPHQMNDVPILAQVGVRIALAGFNGLHKADAKMIVNKDGDLILMNDTQKVRFDVNDPHGYDPHFHIQELNENGDWVDAGDQHHYYFKDK